MATTLPVSQIGEFEKELKKFMDSKQTAEDYVNFLSSYESIRKKNVKFTDIIRALEKHTKTEVPDTFG